jgi:hypothetical protein
MELMKFIIYLWLDSGNIINLTYFSGLKFIEHKGRINCKCDIKTEST